MLLTRTIVDRLSRELSHHPLQSTFQAVWSTGCTHTSLDSSTDPHQSSTRSQEDLQALMTERRSRWASISWLLLMDVILAATCILPPKHRFPTGRYAAELRVHCTPTKAHSIL